MQPRDIGNVYRRHACSAEVETLSCVSQSYVTADSVPASLGVEPRLGPVIDFEPGCDRRIGVSAEWIL